MRQGEGGREKSCDRGAAGSKENGGNPPIRQYDIQQEVYLFLVVLSVCVVQHDSLLELVEDFEHVGRHQLPSPNSPADCVDMVSTVVIFLDTAPVLFRKEVLQDLVESPPPVDLQLRPFKGLQGEDGREGGKDGGGPQGGK